MAFGSLLLQSTAGSYAMHKPFPLWEQQSGAHLFALFALLLLRLPVVFKFHALFALPLLQERSHTLTAERRLYSLQPVKSDILVSGLI